MTVQTRLRPYIPLLLILLCALNAFAFFHNLPTALAGDTDFRALYAAGAIVRTHQGTDLYSYDLQRTVQNTLVSFHPGALPFLYPPYAALAFAPLSAMPYRTAFLAFLALNFVLLWVALCLLGSTFGFSVRSGKHGFLSQSRLVLLSFAFLPVSIAFYQGQVSLFLLLCFAAALAALERDEPLRAGLCLSLALVKFHVVLPVIFLYALWRNWALVGGFGIGTAVLTALCLFVQGSQGLRLYGRTLLSATHSGVIGTEDSYTVFSAKMPNLHGLAVLLLGSSEWTTPAVLLASFAVLAYTALRPPSFPRALLAATLVSYHLHMHDLTLLLLPLLFSLTQVRPARLHLGTALVWFASPLMLCLIATGNNGLLALLMVPFLLPAGRAPLHGSA